VRWLPDGALADLGRRDRQLKVRGFRVEPEEIERCFAAHPAVDRCVVVVREEGGERHLVACCVSEGSDGTDEPGVDAAALRELARTRLPPFMVPEEILVVRALPLTPNGKTDTAALLALRGRSSPVPQAPRDDVERELLGVFRAILKREDLGVSDGFFDSGGDSIRAMQLFAEIEGRLRSGAFDGRRSSEPARTPLRRSLRTTCTPSARPNPRAPIGCSATRSAAPLPTRWRANWSPMDNECPSSRCSTHPTTRATAAS
jgi:hypothetical protein